MDVVATVESLWQELNFRFAVYIKLAAMTSKSDDEPGSVVLSPLFCEESLAPLESPTKRGVSKDLLSNYQSARASANSQLSVARQTVGDHVAQFLEENEEVLCMIDASMVVEQAWLRYMSGDGSRLILEQNIFDVLPDKPTSADPADVALSLERVKNTTAYSFADKAAQSNVNVVVQWAKALAAFRKPSFLSVKDNPFLKNVQSRLRHMVKTTKAASAGATPVTLTGEEALSALIEQLEQRVEAGGQVDLGDLKVFDAFSFILNESQAAKHAAWVRECFERAGCKKPSGASGGDAAQEAKAPSAKKQRKAEDLATATMSLFQKRSKTA